MAVYRPESARVRRGELRGEKGIRYGYWKLKVFSSGLVLCTVTISSPPSMCARSS